ncbi:MAG: type III pantothenate kinase [Saprospiraceae bacterium]|nr:type III pantothenate kinase [Saprospiraceae bacterium]MBP6540023.1 type III pantothenate kinase [Saprospiraceae bacterium]HQV65529.1 type III pantothenate kinase [Saprospiraceae bacterium]
MNLIIDQGNTRVKCAVFNSNDVIVFKSVKLKRYAHRILNELPSTLKIENVILSNTSLPDKFLMDQLRTYQHFLHLDHSTKIPIVNKYGTPETLGKDRIAAAVGAWMKYPNENILFIDMGTCITMNFVNNKGWFLGGNISPGINMRFKAMHKFTANLPLAENVLNDEFIADTTVKALQNGAIKGTFREIDSFITETRNKFGEIKVILTGGDAFFFENWTKNMIFVAPNLVMEGLNEILKYNVK